MTFTAAQVDTFAAAAFNRGLTNARYTWDKLSPKTRDAQRHEAYFGLRALGDVEVPVYELGRAPW